MANDLSPRLAAIADALPLRKGLRVLEVGCGPGALAREVAARLAGGYVLAIDRSAKAIARAKAGSRAQIAAGALVFRRAAIETFELEDGDGRFDFAVAIRVGALDGRHPKLEHAARQRIKLALKPQGVLYVDGGDPLIAIKL